LPTALIVASLCCSISPIATRAYPLGLTPNAFAGGGDAHRDAHCQILYAGYVGSLETAENKDSGVVQIRDTLRGPGYADVCAKSFSPYRWTSGLHWILKYFPARSASSTKDEVTQGPKVILVGHSAGGWAMMSVARELGRRGIPVELAILVDSVGLTDATVPKNVRESAIFYAWDVLLMITTKNLKLADPSRTKLVAHVVVKGANHQSITRDPRIRDLVMKMVTSLRLAAPSEAPEEFRAGDTSLPAEFEPGP
jgi:pimeloyl-ACP methyl ester carboxylesterase